MHRPLITIALAAILSGCAAVGAKPPALVQLDIPDQYSPSTGAEPLSADDLTQCWSWLGDAMLADLNARAPDAQARGEVARRYMALRARQARIANARAYLAAQQDNLEIARFREEAKLVSARDAVQADAERAVIAASIPTLEAQNAADAGRIAVLTGQAPVSLRDRLTPAGPIPTEPAVIGAGLPSDLLTRRPDLAPRLGLGSLQPEKARAAYRQAVLAALEEVETAQASFDGAVAGARALSAAAEKADALARLVRQQYRDGQALYAELSNAETALLRTRDALAEARAQRAAASIDLCVALGGGRLAPVKIGG